MRQPEDNKTIDMLDQKRGRGRPRKEHALTPAERARRYRERKSEQRELFSRDAPRHVTEKDNKVFRLECEISALQGQLESYRKFHEQRAELDDLAQRQFDELRRENEDLRKKCDGLAVTENEDADFWRGMYEAQLERTVELEGRISAGDAKRGISYAQLTELAERHIMSLVRVGDLGEACGVFRLWTWSVPPFQSARVEADRARLRDLVFPKTAE